jgi:hypothetical protein
MGSNLALKPGSQWTTASAGSRIMQVISFETVVARDVKTGELERLPRPRRKPSHWTGTPPRTGVFGILPASAGTADHDPLFHITYLNNLIEQDHRASSLASGRCWNLRISSRGGVELLHRIQQGQFALRKLGIANKTAPEICNACLPPEGESLQDRDLGLQISLLHQSRPFDVKTYRLVISSHDLHPGWIATRHGGRWTRG